MYRTLEAEKVTATLATLHARIAERFPQSGLLKVCGEAHGVAVRTAERAADLRRPRPLLRLAAWGLAAIGVVAQIAFILALHPERLPFQADSFLPVLEPTVNLALLFGGGVWFLLTLETRLKRDDALKALHELRSLAHVIDMHQLTKDPTILLSGHAQTAASRQRPMTRFELTRYLDYCAEMLALIGKLAALYAEGMRDPVVIEAANDIESLTTSLGRKIWQKIMIIGALEG